MPTADWTMHHRGLVERLTVARGDLEDISPGSPLDEIEESVEDLERVISTAELPGEEEDEEEEEDSEEEEEEEEE